MKISGDKKAVTNALQTAFSFAPQRSPKEVLQCVKVIANGDGVTFFATDTESSVQVRDDEIEVEGSGELLLRREVLQSLSLADSERVWIEKDEWNAKLSTGNTFSGLDPMSFPSVSIADQNNCHEIIRDDLIKAIHRTVYATDESNSRFALGGVAFEMDGSSVVLIATDGRRLSVQEIGGTCHGEHVTNAQSAIVPSATIKKLQVVLGKDSADTIRVSFTVNQFTAIGDSCAVQCRLIEGRFPEWRKVMPQNAELTFEIEAGVMASAVRQCAITTDKESSAIDMEVEKGLLQLHSSLSEMGKSDITRELAYDGEPRKLAFDHKFMSDICKPVESGALIGVHIADKNTPMLITTDDGFRGVIMPMAR